MPPPKPIFSRPLDVIYLIYFTTHIPITVFIDLTAIYPQYIIPKPIKDLISWHVTTLGDPFMGPPSPWWFLSFISCEAFLQLPFFFFAIKGLWEDSLTVRLSLIPYSAHVITTVLPILSEILLNPAHGLSTEQRTLLTILYCPYLIVPLLALVDSYFRVYVALTARRFRRAKHA